MDGVKNIQFVALGLSLSHLEKAGSLWKPKPVVGMGWSSSSSSSSASPLITICEVGEVWEMQMCERVLDGDESNKRWGVQLNGDARLLMLVRCEARVPYPEYLRKGVHTHKDYERKTRASSDSHMMPLIEASRLRICLEACLPLGSQETSCQAEKRNCLRSLGDVRIDIKFWCGSSLSTFTALKR